MTLAADGPITAPSTGVGKASQTAELLKEPPPQEGDDVAREAKGADGGGSEEGLAHLREAQRQFGVAVVASRTAEEALRA